MPAWNDRIVLYRFLIVALVFGTALALILTATDGTVTPAAAGLLLPLVANAILSILYLALILRLPALRTARWFTALQYVIDTAVLTVPVALTQGTSSPFLSLYVLLVVAAALTHSTRFAVTTALLSAACLSGVAWFEIQNRLPGVMVPETPEAIGRVLLRVAVYIGSFSLVGVLAGRLVERLRRTDQALEFTRRDFGFLREQYRVIVEQVPSGIALLADDGDLLLLNRSGQRVLAPMLPETQRALLRDLARVGVAEGTVERTLDLPGGSRIFGASATPLDPEVGFAGTLIIFQDVTERRQLEVDLAEQRRLGAIGELSASLAHEIRNPLAAVANSLQMLGEPEGLGPPEHRLLQIMRREIERLEALVADFLRYARPRRPEPARLRVSALLGTIIEALGEHPASQGCRVQLESPGDEPAIDVDPELLRQAAGNLLLNALQWAARPEGQVVVRVLIEPSGDVSLEVEDNGPGIAADDVPHVFEPFWSRREGGTGLGLAIAWSAAQQMGGQLQVKASRPGRTVFELRLSPAGAQGASA